MARAKALFTRFKSLAAGKTGATRESEAPAPMRQKAAEKHRRIRKLRKRLEEKDREIDELRVKLARTAAGVEMGGIRPENIVWIFCTGRSGSTWLASMMEDLPGHARWNEPLVGALFGEFYYRQAAHKRESRHPILRSAYRGSWLRSIRNFVLSEAAARFPEISEGGYLIVKEPHGTIGAPLLMEALPESRMILLVRNPRDVVSSGLDAHKEGSWTSKGKRWQESERPRTLADKDPDTFVKARADLYLRDIGKAKEAYEAHRGLKALVRYEDLRADTLGTMKRVVSVLEIPVDEEELSRVVEKHSWENIPDRKKGEGKFFRKASPGSWREDLTPEQARIVEEIAAPLLQDFYPEETRA